MNQLSKKRLHSIIAILSILALLGITSAIYQSVMAVRYRRTINNGYSRSLSELTDSVRDIEFSLEKGMLVTSPAQVVRLSNEINRSANAAMANLGQLPLSQIQLDNTERFLSQVGDYSNSLAMKVSAGTPLTEEDYAQFKKLAEYCDTLYSGLEKMQSSLYKGNLTMQRLKNESVKENTQYLDDLMTKSEEDFVNYPSLIYDGPFSSHIDTIEYSVLENEREVSQEEAKEIVRKFVSKDNFIIKELGKKEGKLPSYTFEIYPEDSKDTNYTTMDVSRKGGKISWFLNNYSPKSSEISVETAIEKAKSFLNSCGYTNMQENYYECRSNIATVNFASVQDGIVMYPDLIKVKIAMDTGDCIGMETSGYLMNNKIRSTSPFIISEEEAKNKITSLLNIDSVKKTYIPTDSMSELPCYELKGHVDDKKFLVYINATTGIQEKVLVLIESENGVLTI